VGGRTFLVTSNKEIRHLPATPASVIEHEMRKVTKQAAFSDSKEGSLEGCK